MNFMRRAIFGTLFILSIAAVSIAICIAFFLPSRVAVYMAEVWAASVLGLLRLFGIRYKVEGEMPKPGGHFIVASKHQSAWETFALHYLFPPAVFMFKKELLYVPLGGLAMLKEGSIPVNRGSIGRSGMPGLIEKIRRRLKNRNFVIFPEGTRTLPGSEPSYKSGIGTIAAGLGDVTIIPVAHNSGRAWPRKGWPSGPGLITVRIMPAINTKGMDRNEINAAVQASIEEGMKGL